MAKRGLNIYKRKDGRWEGRYKCGYTTDRKAKYRSVYAKSYSAVRTLLEAEKAKSTTTQPCRYTVGELMSLWLADVRNKVKESTYANYVMKLQMHILPHFAGMKYEVLSMQHINDFIRDKLNRGLSEKYVSDIVVLLKSAARFGSKVLGFANRIEYVTMPKALDKTEKPLLSVTERQRLREALISGNSISDIGIFLASVTGIRIGELCALKWSDIDLEKRILTVRTTVQRISNADKPGTRLVVSAPKSRSSVRQIPLPDFIVPFLWSVKSADDSYVLSGTRKLVEPRTLQYHFRSLLKRLALPQINFHRLSHQFATDCIALGIDVKTLSEILGHSSVEITLSRYVHSSMEHKRDCMRLFSDSISVA